MLCILELLHVLFCPTIFLFLFFLLKTRVYMYYVLLGLIGVIVLQSHSCFD